ncbi:Uncharacterised protein [Escherichia coli]|nr:Uncharacterised protein [Escherichia coli]CTW71613.1 Uncharacterised protein [Escherichia coli]CTW86799.1 Uncharacterised protein [Escherichia coli]
MIPFLASVSIVLLTLSGRLPTSSAISTLVMDALPLKIAVFIVGLLWACHLLYSLDLGVYMECSDPDDKEWQHPPEHLAFSTFQHLDCHEAFLSLGTCDQ